MCACGACVYVPVRFYVTIMFRIIFRITTKPPPNHHQITKFKVSKPSLKYQVYTLFAITYTHTRTRTSTHSVFPIPYYDHPPASFRLRPSRASVDPSSRLAHPQPAAHGHAQGQPTQPACPPSASEAHPRAHLNVLPFAQGSSRPLPVPCLLLVRPPPSLVLSLVPSIPVAVLDARAPRPRSPPSPLESDLDVHGAVDQPLLPATFVQPRLFHLTSRTTLSEISRRPLSSLDGRPIYAHVLRYNRRFLQLARTSPRRPRPSRPACTTSPGSALTHPVYPLCSRPSQSHPRGISTRSTRLALQLTPPRPFQSGNTPYSVRSSTIRSIYGHSI